MQEPRDSFSNEGGEAATAAAAAKWAADSNAMVSHHSRQSSRPLENSEDLMQEEFGSAEAMEYTPSNTSQNNSFPTQLVTKSNSNLNLSQAKGSSFNQANVSQSPSPYNYSQIEQSQSRTRSFKDQSRNTGQNQLDFSSVPTMSPTMSQVINNKNAANISLGGALLSQDQSQSIATQSLPGTASQPAMASDSRYNHNIAVLEDDFFDQQASLLMQQQRSSSKQQTTTQQQAASQQLVQNNQRQQQPLQSNYNSAQQPQLTNVVELQPTPSPQSMQLMSQSTTPGFHHQSISQQNQQFQLQQYAAQSQSASRQSKTTEQQAADHQNIQIQNFSVGQQSSQQQVQSHPLQNPPLVSSQKRIVPHQTISLVPSQPQPSQPQPPQQRQTSLQDHTVFKLQEKVREQAQRLQAEAQYRLLCEKRIKKLDPQHPLPLQFEHLEKPAFSPPQVQQVYVNSNQTQGVQMEQNRQLVTHLQSRVSELNRQVADRNALEQRLKLLEESHRNEVLQSEEQRAYIEMLKDQIDLKIQAIGLSFEADQANQSIERVPRSNSRLSNGSGCAASAVKQSQNRSRQSMNRSSSQNKQIDGLIQLTTLQKTCEDLRNQNDLLQAKLVQGDESLSHALNEQRDAFQGQVDQLQNQLCQQDHYRTELNEKNETLLEYAKENIDQKSVQETQVQELQRQKRTVEEEAVRSRKKAQTFEEQVRSKEQLLAKVKENLEEMRAEKLKIQAHLQTLTNEKENLSHTIQANCTSNQDQVSRKETMIAELRAEILSLKERLVLKETSLSTAEKRLDSLVEAEKKAQQQLSAELSRAQNVNSQNFNLKHTLVDSQQEMDTLVTKYDKAVEDLIQRDHKISKLTDDLVEAGREVERLVANNIELKNKAESQGKELFDVYASLRRKEEMLRSMEDRLNRKINEREDQCMQMQNKLNTLEQTFSRDNDNMQQLRQVCREKDQMGENLQTVVQQKDLQNQDLRLELTQLRLENERAYRDREEELLQKIQEKSANEFNLTHQSEKLGLVKDEMEQKTLDAQKLVQALEQKISDNDREIAQKEQERQRWEDEVKRLESRCNISSMHHDELIRDYERIRQQQVDDALLIDRMRIAQGQMKDQVNEIVGKITKFGLNLEDVSNHFLSEELETAYEISKKIQPATQDLQPVLESICQFIKPLSNDVVVRLQNVPERDSDRSSLHQLDYSKGQSCGQDFSRNAVKQKQLSNFTLMSPTVQQSLNNTHNQQQIGRPLNNGFALSSDQQSLDMPIESMVSNHLESHQQVPPQASQQQQLQDTIGTIQLQNQSVELQSELLALKNQIASLEQGQIMDQEENEDLEQAFKIVLQISTLSNPFKMLLQELSMRIRDTNQARREKYCQSSKLLQMEQRFHYQSKMALSTSVQIEITVLKQAIVRERQFLHDLDMALVGQIAEQTRIKEDIMRTNAFAIDQNAETNLKIKRLQELYEEANQQRADVTEKLDWTQTLLNEQRSLRNRFMPRETSAGSRQASIKSRSNSRERSKPQPFLVTSDDRRSNENSQEREAGSTFKSYLQAPPQSNTKTEQELKSEEFNRKKIINSDLTTFRDYTAGAPSQQRAKDETKDYQEQGVVAGEESGVWNARLSTQQHIEVNENRGRSPGNIYNNHGLRALRNRTENGSATSLERSKSPQQMSQASSIIRRKYSQLRTLTARPEDKNNGSRMDSPHNHDRCEPQPTLTVAHLQNRKPLRRSPNRQPVYGDDSPSRDRKNY